MKPKIKWYKVGSKTYQMRHIVSVMVLEDCVYVEKVNGAIDTYLPNREGYRDALKLYLQVTPEEVQEDGQ